MLRKIKLPIKPLPVQPPEEGRPPYPAFVPLNDAFVGRSRVLSNRAHVSRNIDGETYTVDLRAGTCTCRYGHPWRWDAKREKWVTGAYCSHKVRAIADIVEKAGRPPEMMAAYCKAVASRYNVYETVSAFHKELRRGAVDQAVFWGSMLATFRGVKGVINYMLGIVYEETRDHVLAELLLNMSDGSAAHSWGGNNYDAMLAGIRLFCVAPKKWELAHRVEIFEAEMRAYAKLLDAYGRDVAKMLNVVPEKERSVLLARLKKGFRSGGDLVDVQHGMKGLQALKCGDGNLHRVWITNHVLAMVGDNAQEGYEKIVAYIQRKANGAGVSYHDLNMLVDFLMGEPYSAGLRNRPSNTPVTPVMRLGVIPAVPIYALDNHVWAGKALIRRYPDEWQPGAVQEHMDLRLCGAYLGVAFRTLAYAQFKRIDVPWSDVRWPNWMHETVSNLWY